MLRKFYLFIAVLPLLLVASCSKDKSEPQPEPIPVVSTLVPDSGPKGTPVTITGSNFSTDVSKITVYFNGTAATIVSATATEIVAITPAKAGTGKVTVKVSDLTGTGPVFNFVYTISVSTFTGTGVAGFADGSSSVAQFHNPRGMAVDVNGNIYVADELNHRIRMISSNGDVSTFAGSGVAGFADGPPATAKFKNPYDVAYDPINQFIYVADKLNHCVRRISSAGYTTNAAGTPGSAGYVDGPGTSGKLNNPTGVAVEGELTDVYIADASNHCIRKLDYLDIMTTFAGSTTSGLADGNGTGAKFDYPFDIVWDTTGNLFVTDKNNHNIRKITLNGDVTTIAGSGAAGYQNGSGPLAQFNSPAGIVALNGELAVCDLLNNRIRYITGSGQVSSVAGDGIAGFGDGPGASARFNNPHGVVQDSFGDYYIADTQNHCIRKLVID